MQERSSTLPMCSIDRSTYTPSTVASHALDSHSTPSIVSHEPESGNESSTSTPELNLLLDKLTEILRFRSGCRRQSGMAHQQQQQPSSLGSAMVSAPHLKRLQSCSVEPLHNTADVASAASDDSSAAASAWKSSNSHSKSSLSNRSSHHHHHHHTNLSVHVHNLEKKRRLPSLLQRLIDEGNLIKEAVRRLKSQRFSHAFKQQPNVLNTPSTPTTKPLASNQSILSSSSSISMGPHPPQISDSPTQTTSSPSRGISWFLSSSVFGVNASATTHSSESGSPLRTCYSSSTHDRTPMEIGIHDG